MTARARLTVLVIAVVNICAIAAWAADGQQTAPAATTTTSTSSSTTTSSTSSTTTTTAPAETLPPEAIPDDLRCPEWRSILVYVGFTGGDLDTADRILYRESRCSNSATNMTDPNGGSFCAFQLNRIHEARLIADGIITKWDDLMLSATSCASAAYNIFSRSGWAPWGTNT